MKVLRDYQVKAIDELRQAIRNGKKPVLQAPTGAGKTAIFAEIIASARAKGKTVAYVVPLISIIGQTYRAILEAGIDEREIGVMQGYHELTNASAPIQVCSIQTLSRREYPKSDIIIFDEVHILHEAHKAWMQERPDAIFMGASATPGRAGLGLLFDELVVATTMTELTQSGFLCDYRAFGPASPDLSNVSTLGGDFNEGELGEAMDKPQLVGDVVTTWLKLAERRPTFVFAVNVMHAHNLAEEFKRAGVYATYITADTAVEDREEVIRQLEDNLFEVVVSVGTLGTGVDAPFVSCAVLARPTQSRMLHVQQIGRVLRPKPQGGDAMILDHADNLVRLGFPEAIRFKLSDSVADAKKNENTVPLPKKCPRCSYLKPPRTIECPSCGHVPSLPPSVVKSLDGELLELSRDTGQPKNKKTKEIVTRELKQDWWSGLLWIAKERGYKRGWASNKYRKKFAVWPVGLDEIERYPSENLRGWVKKEQIAWAKSKHRENA